VGVLLTPIITKDTIELDALRGQTLAVDGNGELYQFLALIRVRDGTPLQDSKGRTTSHLVGLFYRTTRLIAEHGVKLVFVFDGPPPPRKAQRSRSAAPAGSVRSGASRGAGARRPRVGVLEGDDDLAADERDGGGSPRAAPPHGRADGAGPAEGEAQAAHMAATSPEVWAAASKDYDSLLFGAPQAGPLPDDFRQGVSPSQGTFRPIVPEVIVLDRLLEGWGISREGSWISRCSSAPTSTTASRGSAEESADARAAARPHRAHAGTIRHALGDPGAIDEVRRIFLDPDVTDAFDVHQAEPDLDGIVRFLCDEHEFSRERVTAALERTFRERTLF
jgi:flap endonuclease-1